MAATISVTQVRIAGDIFISRIALSCSANIRLRCSAISSDDAKTSLAPRALRSCSARSCATARLARYVPIFAAQIDHQGLQRRTQGGPERFADHRDVVTQALMVDQAVAQPGIPQPGAGTAFM